MSNVRFFFLLRIYLPSAVSLFQKEEGNHPTNPWFCQKHVSSFWSTVYLRFFGCTSNASGKNFVTFCQTTDKSKTHCMLCSCSMKLKSTRSSTELLIFLSWGLWSQTLNTSPPPVVRQMVGPEPQRENRRPRGLWPGSEHQTVLLHRLWSLRPQRRLHLRSVCCGYASWERLRLRALHRILLQHRRRWGACFTSTTSDRGWFLPCWMLISSSSSSGFWVHCNDSELKVCSVEEVCNTQAYILFYTQRSA